ncbi:uncharacterized protein LTR77_009349 [Saxophila tyrrhenica]|uniref:RRM domain-containing protein n=1 Tax=Saxophila tyrrhenica TaxID=1690608 RepID=A0AAV9NZ63_9PEZI|nr:hypothetical protein LTR77_009349 [Saxophila tyrrhenica]
MSSSDGDEPPNATFIKGIDEKIKIPALIDGIKEVFEAVGDVVDVIAKKNIKARGQAFVVMASREQAETAIDELQGFDLFGEPMTLAFAKTRSDATVLREDGETGLEEHKKKRLAEKERKQALEEADKKQNAAKRSAPENLAERPAKSAKAAPGQLPDDYLPPNKILFLQNLPEDFGKDSIAQHFSQFPGFKEARMVPFRPTIAFVEYEDEGAAVAAKEKSAGLELQGKAVKVTYQRQ